MFIWSIIKSTTGDGQVFPYSDYIIEHREVSWKRPEIKTTIYQQRRYAVLSILNLLYLPVILLLYKFVSLLF